MTLTNKTNQELWQMACDQSRTRIRVPDPILDKFAELVEERAQEQAE